jgi:hypothetical protein
VFDCQGPRVRQRAAITAPSVSHIGAIRGIGGQPRASEAVIQATALDHGRDEILQFPKWVETETHRWVQGNISSDNHRQCRQGTLGLDTGILAQRGEDLGADLPVGNQEFENHLVERLLELQWCLVDCEECWPRMFFVWFVQKTNLKFESAGGIMLGLPFSISKY